MEKIKKIAIITGASSGMGREFAMQIRKEFQSIDEIWLIARNLKRLQRVSDELGEKTVRIFAIDLTKEEDQAILIERLETEKPYVKIAVNAAGYGIMGRFEEQTMQEALGMVDINCKALTTMTYLVLPYMGKGSYLIQVSSASAFLPQPEFSVYAATKAYVLQFSRAIAREVNNRGIVVTAVCPGAVRTRFFSRAQKYQKIKPYKKIVMAKPEKVVEKALHDAVMGKNVSVYGIPMNVFRGIVKMIPHHLILKLWNGEKNK